MKTTLTLEIDYDPQQTDPEGLAAAMDQLMETALSTPDILDEYGNPKVGKFWVAKRKGQPGARRSRRTQRRWVLYVPDTNALLTTRVYDTYAEAADDASQVNDVLVLPLAYQEIEA